MPVPQLLFIDPMAQSERLSVAAIMQTMYGLILLPGRSGFRALPTHIFAAIAAVGTLVSIAVIFVSRYRNRVALGRGCDRGPWRRDPFQGPQPRGTPTRSAGLFFVDCKQSTVFPPGRWSTIWQGVTNLQQAGRAGDFVYVLDEAGRVSRARPIPDAIRSRIAAG